MSDSLPESPEMTAVRLPFQKALTVLLTRDDGVRQADADLAAIESDTATVWRQSPPESYFHQLRLRVAQDPSLVEKIAVFYRDEKDVLHPVGLTFEDEMRWPRGFGDELWNLEVAVKCAREERRKADV